MISRIVKFSMLLATIVLVPFLLWEQSIIQLFEDLLSKSSTPVLIGTIIIVLLALDCVLPTPSSVISAAAAVYFGFYNGMIVIFIGMVLGVCIGYLVGAQIIRIPYMDRVLKVEDVKEIRHFSEQYGLLSLSLARPIPVVAEVSVMVAGASKIPFSKVVVYTLPANGLVAFGYSTLSSMVI